MAAEADHWSLWLGNAPTIRESVAATLSAPERDRLISELARAIRDGRHVRRSAVAYLAAKAGARPS